MRKLILVSVAITFCLLIAMPQIGLCEMHITINEDKIYAQPSVTSKVVGTYEPGTIYEVTDKKDSVYFRWLKVRFAPGRDGWIVSDLLYNINP